MANVGSLTVSLTALTGRFSRGMRKAAGDVTTFAAEVGRASARMLTLASGAGTVAASAVAYLTHRQMEMIDVTAKVADRLGTTTEALIGMRHAANLAGVGADEFDKALEKLSKNLGNPSKEVGEALEKIGLSTFSLLQMTPERRFAAIADGINKLGSQSEKAAVATALFGKTGANLLNTLDLGSKGLAEAHDEVLRLSGAFSRVDAAKVEEANDAITKLQTILAGVGQKLAVMASPLITEVANHLIGMGTEGQSAASKIVSAMGEVAKSLTRVVDLVDVAVAGFLALGAGALKAKSWGQTAGAYWRNWIDRFAPVAPGADGSVGVRESGADIQARFLASLDEAGKSADQAAQAFALAKQKLAEAQAGQRSGDLIATINAAYDRIVAAATGRAKTAVDALAGQRKAASDAERKKAGEQLAQGFASFLQKGRSFANELANNATGSMVVADLVDRVGSFFRSLPERAIKAGFRPDIDLQTSTRGTFSGETAARQTSVLSVQTKQLETQRMMLDQLNAIRGGLSGGIALQ